jgi:hypothetical protein
VIRLDARRTPPRSFFGGEVEQRALVECLRTACHIWPALGYTQGMNFIMGAILRTFYEAEHKLDSAVLADSVTVFSFILQRQRWGEVFSDGFPKLIELAH